jgi:hypothetical protein
MEAFFLAIRQIPRYSFYLIALFLLANCKQKHERKVHPSFYYWKTIFLLSEKEVTTLSHFSIQNLYVKFFDVEWNEGNKNPAPVAIIKFKQPPPKNLLITPVVFITNEVINNTSNAKINELASNLVKLLSGIALNNKLNLSREVQIDCDWTASSKEKYFALLKAIKQNAFVEGKILSATIRLHQLKFISLNGIPPVDKALLMCYNMGNLKHPETKNSIIEVEELKKYINALEHYSLPLDIALPLFNWYVWFRGMEYKGLIHNFPNERKEQRIVFKKDTTTAGYNFKEGDWLRYETSKTKDVTETAKLLSRKLNNEELNVILYHLDENNLNNYKEHELEDMFNSLR